MKKSLRLSTLLITFVLLTTAMTATPGASGSEPGQEVTTARSLTAKWQWMTNPTADASPAADAALMPDQGGLTAGTPIYRVHVQDNPLLGTGLYTFTTGPDHPAGADQNILYGNGVPATSFNTIHSYTSGRDYVQLGLATPIPGARPLSLFGAVTPIGMTGFRTTYRLPGPPATSDALTIISDVNVNGECLQDASIEVTTTVINNGSMPVAIGIRYLWDVKIGEDDGPTFRELMPGSPVRQTEASFSAPQFEQYRVRDNDISPDPPTFTLFGTVTGPASVRPTPTAPNVLQYVCWSEAVKTAFEYRLDPTRQVATNGVPCQLEGTQGGDSAVLYFFGATRDTALVIPPGGMQKVSASLRTIP